MPAISSAINATQASVAFTAALQRLPMATSPHPDNDLVLGGRQQTTTTTRLTKPSSTAASLLGNVLQSLSNISATDNQPANPQLTSEYASSEESTAEQSWLPHEHHVGVKRSVGGGVVTTEPVFPSPPPSMSVFSTLSIESLVASSSEDLSGFRDVTFDIFDDEGDELFGSPLAFDASDNGLWNGRFVPPPPRPPFFVDEPVFSDGLTTCDLCSWAMPTKSTFIFEGTIEKASELGWPLTLIIVSILSAVLGAIIMVTVVHCRRNKNTNNRNADPMPIQWWSRHKRSSVSASSSGRPADIALGLGPVGGSTDSPRIASAPPNIPASIMPHNISATLGATRRGNIYTGGPIGRHSGGSGSATLPLRLPPPPRDEHPYYRMPLPASHNQQPDEEPECLRIPPPPPPAVGRSGCHWPSPTAIVAS